MLTPATGERTIAPLKVGTGRPDADGRIERAHPKAGAAVAFVQGLRRPGSPAGAEA